jgi:bifunctional non-homologous end joining protein LigD
MIKGKRPVMLKNYAEKRHFERTPEPSPGVQSGQGPLVFVVQKHSARRLHYDLRLEVEGVLKSWAVPQGPSLDPKVKRLAVMVEDHPIEYQSFEGIIPEGEYGAGQVIVWDRGFYFPEEEGKVFSGERNLAEQVVQRGLAEGKLSLNLHGTRLKGSWALVKMKNTKNDWLLIKHQDEFADPGIDILESGNSVISGLSIQDLKEGRTSRQVDAKELEKIPGARQARFPDSLGPMMASLTQKPFSDPAWIFEPKLDGFRILSFIDHGEVKLMSRNQLVVSHKYPEIVESLKKQAAGQLVMDGEVVALDKDGRSCFQCLQDHWQRGDGRYGSQDRIESSIVYYVFDILYLNGFSLMDVPLRQRKGLLARAFSPSGNVRLVEFFEKDGLTLYEASVKMGLEGVMAKREDSVYESGRRSANWLKIKATRSDEFVIGGFTRGAGNRADSLGALLLGNYDDKGQLVFAGHVGTGFNEKSLAELRRRLEALKTEKSPFPNAPRSREPATWVKPQLVAEVKFAERTQEGLLRAPVFLRLREDKAAAEVQLSVTASGKVEKDPSPRSSLEKIIEQFEKGPENLEVEFGADRISFSNLGKALWPAVGKHRAVTKRDLLIYLARISPYLLPHLKDRPLTLTRYPNGIHGEHFFQKHWSGPLPGFVKTYVLSERESGTHEYLVCDNLATLLWLGQMANIDLHTWFSRITPGPIAGSSVQKAGATPDFFSQYPDFIIFDIDPYIYSGHEPAGAEPELNPRAFEKTCQVAQWLKDTLDSLFVDSFIKTSGRTGLHIYVPLVRRFDFSAVHSAAKTLATYMFQNHPQDITIDWSVAARTGKVFLDYNQNVRGKTLASVYSPRPAPEATVSAPVLWSEIGQIYPTDFTLLNMPDRAAKLGDLWKNILAKRSDLSKILKL